MIIGKTKGGDEVKLSIGVVILLAGLLAGLASTSGITLYRLGKVEDRLKVLSLDVKMLTLLPIELQYRTRDRWTKADDKYQMSEFARINKLVKVQHERIVSIAPWTVKEGK